MRLKFPLHENHFSHVSHFILQFNNSLHMNSFGCYSDMQPSINIYDVNLSQLLISYKLHLRMKIAPEWRQ